MSVLYHVVARKNPQNREAAEKYYATLGATGQRDLRYIATVIADKSSLNIMDVKAVLEGFIQVIPEILNDGYTVDLDEFGNFHLTCTSEGSDTIEDVTAANIKKVNLQFRPGKLIRQTLNNTEFKKKTPEQPAS